MESSFSEFNKTLAEINKEAKFESLAALEFGNKKINELLQEHPLLNQFVQVGLSISKMSNSGWLKSLRETHKAIRKYLNVHITLSKGIHALTAEGWYFSVEFIDALAISNLDEYLINNPEGFNADVISTFENQIVLIEKKLNDAYPRREKLIKTIFQLHRDGFYVAAILLALAQADGISKESFTIKGKDGKTIHVGFFEMTNSKSEVRAQKLSHSFEVSNSSMFSVLYNQLAKEDRNDSLVLEGKTTRLSDLNRHAIMHGESVDYGTKINSIKAILLLDFIEDLHMMDIVLKEKMEE